MAPAEFEQDSSFNPETDTYMNTRDGALHCRINPNGHYAWYKKKPGVWAESAKFTNDMIRGSQRAAAANIKSASSSNKVK